jgi:hypothetical protein
MAGTGRLAVCIDECLGVKIAPVLRELRAPGSPHIHHLRDLNLAGVSDETLFHELEARNFAAMVTKDSAILAASVRRDAWRATGMSLFVLHGHWGNLPLFEQARRLIWWWPEIIRQTDQGSTQAAWIIRKEMSGSMERKF